MDQPYCAFGVYMLNRSWFTIYLNINTLLFVQKNAAVTLQKILLRCKIDLLERLATSHIRQSSFWNIVAWAANNRFPEIPLVILIVQFMIVCKRKYGLGNELTQDSELINASVDHQINKKTRHLNHFSNCYWSTWIYFYRKHV